MRVCLERAKHVILLGYSLPKDDFVYRSLLSARMKKEKPLCTVVIGKDGPDKMIEPGEMEDFTQKNKQFEDFIKTVKQAQDIIGKDKVRGYCGGIPRVFLDQGRVSKERIIDLLYPKSVFLKGFVERKIR